MWNRKEYNKKHCREYREANGDILRAKARDAYQKDKKKSQEYAEKRRQARLHTKTGKTLEEIYGEEKATEWRANLSKAHQGKSLSKEHRESVSLSSKGKAGTLGMTGKHHSEATLEKLRKANSTLRVREILRSAARERWSNPEYAEKRLQAMPGKYVTGWFSSDKNKTAIYFRSSYELEAFCKLEEDDRVVSYESCYFSIPYSLNGVDHCYIPDILITYEDRKQLIIEIKPHTFMDTPEVVAKIKAAVPYCIENGMDYRLWVGRPQNGKVILEEVNV